MPEPPLILPPIQIFDYSDSTFITALCAALIVIGFAVSILMLYW